MSQGKATGCNVYCTIPAATVPGNYYIGYIVDADNQVLETNEDDNVIDSPISVVVTK